MNLLLPKDFIKAYATVSKNTYAVSFTWIFGGYIPLYTGAPWLKKDELLLVNDHLNFHFFYNWDNMFVDKTDIVDFFWNGKTVIIKPKINFNFLTWRTFDIDDIPNGC